MTSLLDKPDLLPTDDADDLSADGGRGSRSARLRSWAAEHRTTLLWLVPLLVLTALSSWLGSDGSPQRIDDEGTYVAQAYAVGAFGELSHYTYWYDHPPLGWLQISAWTWLTNGFGRYDVAVLAGRELMVVLHVVSAALLWVLGRRLGLSRPAAAASLAVYAFSPLVVQFTRTVFLDNVATPWMLAAFVLALTRRNQLVAFAASAVCFGVAVLSKETYLLLLPFLVWTLWRSAHPSTRRYTLSVAAALLVLVGTSYIVFAFIKGEVLPGQDRVSLLDGVLFQLVQRDGSGSVLDAGSQAGASARAWLTLDPVLPVAATLAALAALAVRRLRIVAALFLFLLLVLFKPGYVPVPQVIVMLPFAALLVAGVVDALVRSPRRTAVLGGVTAAVLTVGVAAPLWGPQLRGLYLADLDRPMREAQAWLSANVEDDEAMIVDDAVWVDLVEAGFDRDQVVWYYKPDTDPAVADLAPNGWRDYDWVLVTEAVRESVGSAPVVSEALANATRTAVFGNGDQAVEIYQVHPEGAEAQASVSERDQRARLAAGRALADNPRLELSPDAEQSLLDGRVDSRLVSLLALAAGEHRLGVEGFPSVFGEDGQILARTVTISSVDGRIADAAGPDLASLVRDQIGPYQPESVVVDDGDLQVRFPVAETQDLLPDSP